MSDLDDELRRTIAASGRRVFWHPRRSPAEEFARLARACEVAGVDELDSYGERGAVVALERQVAALLGVEEAVLFPTGVMAQQCALRVWCDRQGSRRVAIQDLSHLLHHEDDGPRRLHGFEFEPLTTGRRIATAESLAAVPGRLGAVVVEWPLRDAGCLLPDWNQVEALSAAARERGVPLHADGARVWEASAAWDRPLTEIGGVVDSVYVSLYKGLGGMRGALVAGSAEVATELRIWRRRMGGTVFRMTTEAVGGLLGLREELPRMPEILTWARALAAELGERGLRCHPDPPHISTFEVYAEGEADRVNQRLLDDVRSTDTAISPPWRGTDAPGVIVTELATGSSALDHDPAVVATAIATLVAP